MGPIGIATLSPDISNIIYIHTYIYIIYYQLQLGLVRWQCCINNEQYIEVEVTLRLTVNQSVCLGIEHRCGTCDQILFLFGMLLSEICGLVSVGRPL
jgi:hypothetical protein